MESSGGNVSSGKISIKSRLAVFFTGVPLLSWVLAILAATALEHFFGRYVAENVLNLEKLPALFGFIVMHRQPLMLPNALIYTFIFYIAPIVVVVRLGSPWLKRVSLSRALSSIPLLGWLLGIFAAVLLEHWIGVYLAEDILDLNRIPVLFGTLIIFKEPDFRFNAILYVLSVYFIPATIVARILAWGANMVAARLLKLSVLISVLIHLALIYGILHFWSDVNGYRLLIVRLIMIAIILTLSLNVINGYMGEFSCSHPGFMALGAYTASLVTILFFDNKEVFGKILSLVTHAFFIDGRIFGYTLTPETVGPFIFPLAIIAGGIVASLGALLIAIPSFRTRGDYLAIISLAFMFIVKSAIENMEIVGGPRGLGGHPDWANLPTVFIWCVLCIWIINNFVSSILGKATNTVRDDEGAADAMTINTRRTKMVTFMFGAFWAGVAGGLFAHVLRYVNPGSFYFQRLAEVLAMMYFGGLNSVYGSIMGAVSLSLLSEALRPLEIFKWIIIPLILILIMIFRPKGLISFKEFNVMELIKPKTTAKGEK